MLHCYNSMKLSHLFYYKVILALCSSGEVRLCVRRPMVIFTYFLIKQLLLKLNGTFVGVPADVRDVLEVQWHADIGLRELARFRLTAALYRVCA